MMAVHVGKTNSEPNQQAHDAMITSLYNVKTTSFRRHNDDIIALFVRWDSENATTDDEYQHNMTELLLDAVINLRA